MVVQDSRKTLEVDKPPNSEICKIVLLKFEQLFTPEDAKSLTNLVEFAAHLVNPRGTRVENHCHAKNIKKQIRIKVAGKRERERELLELYQ